MMPTRGLPNSSTPPGSPYGRGSRPEPKPVPPPPRRVLAGDRERCGFGEWTFGLSCGLLIAALMIYGMSYLEATRPPWAMGVERAFDDPITWDPQGLLAELREWEQFKLEAVSCLADCLDGAD